MCLPIFSLLEGAFSVIVKTVGSFLALTVISSEVSPCPHLISLAARLGRLTTSLGRGVRVQVAGGREDDIYQVYPLIMVTISLPVSRATLSSSSSVQAASVLSNTWPGGHAICHTCTYRVLQNIW